MKYLLIAIIFLSGFGLYGEINFGSKASMVSLGAGGILNIKSPQLYVDGGNIFKTENGSITGSSIRFNRGVLSDYISEFYVTGSFVPAHEGVINSFSIGDNPDANDIDTIVSNPGGFRNKLFIKSGTTLLRGQPLFLGNATIELQDETSLLAIAMQNTLNTAVVLNGGIIYLQDDLRLGDDAIFYGNGLVVLNNRRFSFGGSMTTWDGNITWYGALDLHLNSRTVLRGTWLFDGDAQINGNGNVLDIADGGTIIVTPGTSLRMSGVRLKGVGTGNLRLGEGSQIRLSDVEIEMDKDFDVVTGGIYIDGATNIITKNNFLTFDQNGSLTIDRVPLTYDPVEFIDRFNVRPLRIQDPNHKYISIINNGSIRRFKSEAISFLDYSCDAAMQRYAVVMPIRPIKVFPESINGKLNYEVKVDGATNFLRFTRAFEPLMFMSDHVHAVYKNVVFQDFLPDHLSLGEDATLVWGDRAAVQLPQSADLNYTWTFDGRTQLRGGGAILTLGPKGAIVLQGEHSALSMESIIIKGVSGEKIRCLDNSSKIVLKDVTWVLDGDFTFAHGGFEVLTNWEVTGPYIFDYTSTQTSSILVDAVARFSKYIVFNYNPDSGGTGHKKDLLKFTDWTSNLVLSNYATISAPAPGVQLTKGTLVVEKYAYTQNDNAHSQSEGIILGDGNYANNLTLDKSGTLEIWSGYLVDHNVAS